MNGAWVILVIYSNLEVNISQDAYKTYNEARAWVLKKHNVDIINDYRFFDRDNNIMYELKNVYIK